MKTLEYPFHYWHDDGVVYVRALPPLDNVLTFGADEGKAEEAAREAVTGVLGALLDRGEPVPPPPEKFHCDGVWWIGPNPRVAWPVLLRMERERAGLTQSQLAQRLGVTFQAVQKWERSGANPTLATADRILRALGRRLALTE